MAVSLPGGAHRPRTALSRGIGPVEPGRLGPWSRVVWARGAGTLSDLRPGTVGRRFAPSDPQRVTDPSLRTGSRSRPTAPNLRPTVQGRKSVNAASDKLAFLRRGVIWHELASAGRHALAPGPGPPGPRHDPKPLTRSISCPWTTPLPVVENPPHARGPIPLPPWKSQPRAWTNPHNRGTPKPPHLALDPPRQPQHLVFCPLTALPSRRNVHEVA